MGPVVASVTAVLGGHPARASCRVGVPVQGVCVERLGRYRRTLTLALNFIIPIASGVSRRVDARARTGGIPPVPAGANDDGLRKIARGAVDTLIIVPSGSLRRAINATMLGEVLDQADSDCATRGANGASAPAGPPQRGES